MNATQLFLRGGAREAIVHVRSATSRMSRTADELRANVASLGAGLRTLGVEPGSRVLILCGSRIESVEMMLAVLNLGATAMPVTPTLGAAHIVDIIERMQPTCCMFEDAPDAIVAEALAELDCPTIAIHPPRAAMACAWRSYEAVLGSGAAPLDFPQFPDGQLALVIHSSGSTGKLKAVTMTHGDLLRFFEFHDLVHSQYSEDPGQLTCTSPIVTGLPISHIAGLGMCLQALMSERRAYLLSFFLPEVYLKLIEEARCASILLVPSLYRALLRHPDLRKTDLSSLRFCITGGEPCPPELLAQIEAAFGVPLVTGYSMTECLCGLGHTRHDLFGRRFKPGSCGRQLFGELKLCDPEGRENPSVGELWVRNATVHPCYLDQTLLEQRLVNGWFRTGDLFYRDADGEFFHRGRVDDMFICNGKNIYPLEIEMLLMKHGAIDALCAAPVNSRRKGTVPGVLIVPKRPVSEAEIREFSMKMGPSHAIPQVVQFDEALPLLGPGKVDRKRVAQILQDALDRAEM